MKWFIKEIKGVIQLIKQDFATLKPGEALLYRIIPWAVGIITGVIIFELLLKPLL